VTDEESVDQVDEEDHVVGRVTRAQMRALNLLHRSVAVMCQDARGRIYVQRRSETKDVFPGLYDMFVGGVVAAGESYEAAARREIEEELGIAGPQPALLFRHRYDGPCSRSHTFVYRVVWDGPIRHQLSEVAWGGYCTLDEIATNPGGWRFVPDGWEIFQRYLAG
jgi:isopentenyldiphosphate isomerase